jgi:hypothetical protein
MLIGLEKFKIKQILMDLILELIQNFYFQMVKFILKDGVDLKLTVLV